MPKHVAHVTVAIATHERPAGLVRCLDALLSGSSLPAEVVIVDQSEGDRTAAAVADRAASAPIPIRYVHQNARGLSRSRNEAARAATQDLIAVTDDDCVPHEQRVEIVARTLEASSGIHGVGGRVLPLGPEVGGFAAVSTRASTERRDYTGKMVPWIVGTGANFAVRREWLERIGAYDVRLGAGSRGGAGEDMDVLYRLLRADARLRYEPDAIVYHERQPLAQRARSRGAYGRGIGACCGLWLREGDAFAAVALARWFGMRLGRLMRTTRSGGGLAAREEVDVLRGTLGGLAYGLLVRGARSTPEGPVDAAESTPSVHSATTPR